MGARVEKSYDKWSKLLEEYQVIDDRILGPAEEKMEQIRVTSSDQK